MLRNPETVIDSALVYENDKPTKYAGEQEFRAGKIYFLPA